MFNICRSQINVNLSKYEAFQTELNRTSIEHRRPSINVRSPLPSTHWVTKDTISQSANSESFRAKMRNTRICFPILTILYLFANCLYCHVKRRKARHFRVRVVDSFALNGIGEASLSDLNGFTNTTNVYSVHLELRMALPYQISIGKWKYVNPCLDFLSVYPINVRRTQNGKRYPDGRPYEDQVSPPTW